MAENSRWAAVIETIGDAALMAMGLGYLTRHAKQTSATAPTGAAGATVTAPTKSPFHVGPIGGLTMQDEINYSMVISRCVSGLDEDGIKDFQSLMDEIGTFGIGQRKAIKMRIAGEYSDIVEKTLEQKTRMAYLPPAEITRIINEIKALVPAGTTIDEAQLKAVLEALRAELTNTPIEAINEALDEVVNREIQGKMMIWHENGKLKENLIAKDYIPEFDGEQWFRDWVKGQRDTIKKQWKAVYGDTPWEVRLEGAKANAEAEDILRPIGREIKNLDANIYDQLEAEIRRIRAITDSVARLQEAQQFKTTYETQYKTNAELAGEQLRQQEEAKRNSYREFPIHFRNPFRRRP